MIKNLRYEKCVTLVVDKYELNMIAVALLSLLQSGAVDGTPCQDTIVHLSRQLHAIDLNQFD